MKNVTSASVSLVFFLLSCILLTSIEGQCQATKWEKSKSSNKSSSSLLVKKPVSYTQPTRKPNAFILPILYQDSTLIYQVITIDGNEFLGSILEEDSKKIVLRTKTVGDITIQKVNIRKMILIESEKIKDGAYWKDHMQSTRHFWSPNGYGLRKGEAYYQNVWLFFNHISVGITDNILLGGGIMPFFLLGGSPTPVWITPKVSFPVVENKINLGVGGLFATVIGEPDANLGIAYGTATFGPRDKNVTVGVGYGYAGGDWASKPTFSLSYISRVGRKGYFISENYLLSNENGFLFLGMIGGRSILGRREVGLDYGLVIPISTDIGSFIAIPWLGLTVPLGQN